MALDPALVAILRCPQCRGALRALASDGSEASEADARAGVNAAFGCAACGLRYAVEDDLPNFLVEEARSWSPPGGARGAAPGEGAGAPAT
jgi:uncharacterized protein YbaR (Trm112 family)